MVAARISCSNTELFCPLNWLCHTSKKMLVYVPGACVHSSHDPRAHLASYALDQTFRLEGLQSPDWTSVLPITAVLPGSCGLWADPSHCPQSRPAPSLGAVGCGAASGWHGPASPRATLGSLPRGSWPSQTPSGLLQSVYKNLLLFVN